MSDITRQIKTPTSPLLDQLCEELASPISAACDADWPTERLRLCAEFGVFRWFVPRQWGGYGWQPREIVSGYLRLGAACLTTTFIITQWVAAVSRMLASEKLFADDEVGKRQFLASLMSGSTHTTVGISHLTTSGRHFDRPALRAVLVNDHYVLEGFSPWVTAAPFASHFLIGATLGDGDQLLLVVAAGLDGIDVQASQELVALSASHTARVRFNSVRVPAKNLVAGPSANVMAGSRSAGVPASSGSGGLQTSTLALALARAAIDYIEQQAAQRTGLVDKARALSEQWDVTSANLFQMADGEPVCSSEDLRTRANSLVLRATQAALVAAKGAGFVEGHPVGRWCREALFFLVWSCPQTVLDANMCELARIEY